MSTELLTPKDSAARPAEACFDPAGLTELARRFREPAWVLQDAAGRRGLTLRPCPRQARTALAQLPGLYPEWLGERAFCEAQGTRFPYVSGAMANGIATTRLVAAVARAGGLGVFGAAGLELGQVEAALERLGRELDPLGLPWGSNLIHDPHEPRREEALAELYIRRGVRCVSASAFLRLTPAVVRCAVAGLREDGAGGVRRARRLIAKVSRAEVARAFLDPAPAGLLRELQERELITAVEARLGARVPLVEDLTCEADSGGHTDRRPLSVLLPELQALARRRARAQGRARAARVGAAGGLGTPAAVAAAFQLGAAYVLTGSVNQACVESGLSPAGRALLAEARPADVALAPAADMFELGAEVQVLSRGTLFAARARRLQQLYRAHPSLEAIPTRERRRLESQLLRCSLAEAWAATRAFWAARDPAQVERAERDPKHRMALVFRSYLGRASRWAITGEAERRADFQIWCGPAMGAFNAWVAGSFLEPPESRTVRQVALNLLEGAAALTRAQQLRSYGLPLDAGAFAFPPRPLE